MKRLTKTSTVTSGSTSSSQRLDVQGMRGVAVLLVVLSHAGLAAVAGGYVGVDVFFVLSGFLITGILLKEARHEGKVSIARFYGNRAKRILPVGTLVLVITAFAGAGTLNLVRARSLFDDITAAALFVANWRFAIGETDYFAQGEPHSAVQHYWSLAVEEQFYFLWPLLIGAAFYGARKLHRPGVDRRQLMLGSVLAVITVASFTWSVMQTSHTPTFAYFSTFTRAWELGVGGLLAIFATRLRRMPSLVKAAASWLGVAAIVTSALLYTDGTPVPGAAAALPVLGTAGILFGGMVGPRFGARVLLEVLPLRWLGDISYSLYLWHWPLLVLGSAYLGRTSSVGENLMLMAVAVLLSALSYYLLENPVRNRASLRREPRHALVFWPAAVAGVVVPLSVIGPALLSSNNQAVAQAARRADVAIANVKQTNADASDLEVAVALADKGGPLPSFSPDAAHVQGDVSYMPSDCRSGRGSIAHTVCEMGDPRGKKTMVLMGDSTAAMYVPGISRAAKKLHWSFRPLVKYQCPAADVLQIQEGKAFRECAPWRRWAERKLAKIHPDVVVLVGLTNLNEATDSGATESDDLGAWQAGTERTVAKVKRHSGSVIVLGMMPRPTTRPVDCLSNPKSTMQDCSFPIDDLSDTSRAASLAGARAAGARYVDWLDWVCADGICPEVIGSNAVWADSHHLTATFSRSLRDPIAKAMQEWVS
ncbi:MAG: acyltransferase family protein [Nocardioidaceae bacterium]